MDVSKGMCGYYAGKSATRFKTDVWSVLSSLNGELGTDSVVLLSEKKPKHISLTDFRDKMNAGKLLYDNNTSIPQMIENIVTGIDTIEGMVAVLISDMKYSPTGNSSPQALMAQYATDISNILARKEIATSLICAVSDYRTASQTCDESPYYYLVVGNPKSLSNVRNEIVLKLKSSGSFVEVVESGVEYDRKLVASHVKAKGIMPLDKDKLVYGGYNSKVTDTIAITIGLNLSPFPHFLWNSDSLMRYIIVDASGLARCDVSDIEVSEKMAEVTLKIYNFKEKDQKFAITLGGYNPSLPRKTNQFYGAIKENDCDKTISIDQFIWGIADKRKIQSSVEITIIKDNKL